MRVEVAEESPWSHESVADLEFYWSGHEYSARSILALCKKGADSQTISVTLASLNTHFSVIVRGSFGVLACVDKIRSIPIFYMREFAVSPDARWLRDNAPQGLRASRTGHVEFVMAGYVTGNKTLFDDLWQLQAGEFLLHSNSTHGQEVCRYYQYLPRGDETMRKSHALEEYRHVVDEVFQSMIQRLNGRPAWIPLSGGYDSRIIVCKLHEMGYDNIVCFSYGPRQNHDARVAKHVSETLDVPWLWLPSHAKETRQSFLDERRKAYWRYADGLSVMPSIREWHTLLNLVDSKSIPDDAVLINGQTGDYLSGGHIPAELMGKPDREDLIDKIIDKHYGLWRNWSESSCRDIARQTIMDSLCLPDAPTRTDITSAYESWEYQERQAKFVVGGQRMYEFFGFDWELPHWDGRFLDFWEKIPISLKYQQNLYKTYLRDWNYKSLYRDYDPFVWRWPVHMMWVLGAAKLVGITAGARQKQNFYRFLWYFSHYHNLYAIWGYSTFIETWRHARGPISLQVRTWLQENGMADDPNLSMSWESLAK